MLTLNTQHTRLALMTLLGTCMSHSTMAATPTFSITPTTATSIIVTPGQVATVTYTVTNNTPYTLNGSGLTHLPTGLQQQPFTLAGDCTTPFFNLAPYASCTLNLQVTADNLPAGGIKGGPRVCQTPKNPIYCAEPSPTNALAITRGTTPGMATLSISTSTLVLAKQGIFTLASGAGTGPNTTPSQSRTLTITNQGPAIAKNVTYNSSPALSTDTTITLTSCDDIPVNGTCLLTIAPGSESTLAPGVPVPSLLTIEGTNTTAPVTANITVLTYGNTYQGGLVFSIDDTTPITGSVGGKVVMSTDGTASPWTEAGGTFVGAQSITDGAQNTTAIVADTSCSINTGTCAAYQCDNLTTLGDGFSDWYLPAICEMGFDTNLNDSGCGNSSTPFIQNIQSNLSSVTGFPAAGYYWSSTESDPDYAWLQVFSSNSSSSQDEGRKDTQRGVRCSRGFIP